MKSRILPVLLILSCGAASVLLAISPKLPNDPETDNSLLPSSQEATEQAVLPDEPILSTPTPEPLPEVSGLPVQALPSEGVTQPSGPTSDEKRRETEAFRAAKTAAEERPELDALRKLAFESRTEREKRALLRQYYQTISASIVQASPNLKDSAEAWAFAKQNRLARRRTEPDYQPVTVPDAMITETPDAATPAETPAETPEPLPGTDN